MFNNSTDSNDEKLDNLIEEFKEFKNKRKITELDLEKKMVSLEGVFEKIKKNIDIIQNIEDADALKDIKKSGETIRSLEDLTLTDRLEIIQNKENIQGFSEKIGVFNKKIDLMSKALKIFDEKIKSSSKDSKGVANDSDLVTILDELSKIKDTISSLEKKKPVGETEFNKIHNDFEKVNTDFATLISGVREELGTYDKKIEILVNEIENIKNVDTDIGKNESKYSGMLNVIKKLQTISRMNKDSICELGKDTDMKINTLTKNMDKLTWLLKDRNIDAKDMKKGEYEPQNYELTDKSDKTIQNIELKINELNKTISNITGRIEDEKTYTNQKISNAMDAIKDMIGNWNENKNIENSSIEKINNEINTIKSEYVLKQDIEKNNLMKKEQAEDVKDSIETKEDSLKGIISEKLKNIIPSDADDEFKKIDAKINRIDEKNSSYIDTMQEKVYNILSAIQKEIHTLKNISDTKNKRIENKIEEIKQFNKDIVFNVENQAEKIRSEIEEKNKSYIETGRKNKEEIEDILKKGQDETTKDIESIKNSTESKISLIEDKIIQHKEEINEDFEQINETGHEIVTVIKKIEESLETETVKTFIKKLEELEKIRKALKAESLNDFLIRFGEMKVLKDKLTDDFNDLKETVVSLQSKVEGGLEDKVEKELSESIKNIKEIAEKFTKDVEESEKINNEKIKSLEEKVQDSVSKIEKTEIQLKEDTGDFKKMQDEQMDLSRIKIEKDIEEKFKMLSEEQRKNPNFTTNEDMKKIVDEQNKKFSEVKTELNKAVESAKTELSKIQKAYPATADTTDAKDESKALTDIQIKINKAIKEKIDNIEKKISQNENQNDTKSIIDMISQLRKENKTLSEEIKELKEQLSSMEHTGRAESTPLILE